MNKKLRKKTIIIFVSIRTSSFYNITLYVSIPLRENLILRWSMK